MAKSAKPYEVICTWKTIQTDNNPVLTLDHNNFMDNGGKGKGKEHKSFKEDTSEAFEESNILSAKNKQTNSCFDSACVYVCVYLI